MCRMCRNAGFSLLASLQTCSNVGTMLLEEIIIIGRSIVYNIIFNVAVCV